MKIKSGLFAAATLGTLIVCLTANGQVVINNFGDEVINQTNYIFEGGSCILHTEIDVFTDQETELIECVALGLSNNRNKIMFRSWWDNQYETWGLALFGFDDRDYSDFAPQDYEKVYGYLRIDQNKSIGFSTYPISPHNVSFLDNGNLSDPAFESNPITVKNLLTQIKNGKQRLAVRFPLLQGTTLIPPLTEIMPLNGEISAAIGDFLYRIQDAPAFSIED